MRPHPGRPWRGRGGPPLHFRLLTLSSVCFLLLWGLFTLLWRMGPSPEDKQDIEHTVQFYVGYLAKDLGTHPSQAQAQTLAQASGWNFRWLGADQSAWATDPQIPEMEELRKALKPGRDWGWTKGRFFCLKSSPLGTVALAFRPWKPPRVAGFRLAFFIWSVLCIMAFATLLARRMLRPLRDLDAALASLAEGDFAARLPEPWRQDELGRLTRRFNQTAAEVGRMLQSRRQLLLDVSHELRTPLTRLNLGLEMLPDPAARESLKEDVAEMEAMLAELLEGARLEEAARWQPQPVDLVALARTVAEDLEGRKPGLKLDLPAEGLVVPGDARGLQILLRNVLDNALKYSSQQKRPAELRLWQDGDQACLSIRDHGTGIPEAALSHVFEPFYRADAARTRGAGGFGLGLHLVQRVALAHGGEAKVENAPGGGALFSVCLPLAR